MLKAIFILLLLSYQAFAQDFSNADFDIKNTST